MNTKCKLFEENSQYAIIADVFAKAAMVDSEKLGAGDAISKNEFYHFIEETPYTSMMVHLVDAMKELGYKVVEI
jgi:hypothetical protein